MVRRPPSSVLSASDDDDRYSPRRTSGNAGISIDIDESSVSTYNESDYGPPVKNSLTNLSTASTKILDNTMKGKMDEAAARAAAGPAAGAVGPASPTGSNISRNSIAASRLLRARQQRSKQSQSQSQQSPRTPGTSNTMGNGSMVVMTTPPSAAAVASSSAAAAALDDESTSPQSSSTASNRRRNTKNSSFKGYSSKTKLSQRGVPISPASSPAASNGDKNAARKGTAASSSPPYNHHHHHNQHPSKKSPAKSNSSSPAASTQSSPSSSSPLASSTQSIASSASARRILRTRAKQSRTRNVGLGKLVGKPPADIMNSNGVMDHHHHPSSSLSSSAPNNGYNGNPYYYNGNDDDDDDDEDESNKIKPNLNELDEERERTRAEFSQGNAENSRYREEDDDDLFDGIHGDNQAISEASMPSMLERSEVFHENATAAVLALLTPRGMVGGPNQNRFPDSQSVSSASLLGDNNSISTMGTFGTTLGIQVESTERGIIMKSPGRDKLAPFQPPRANNISDTMSMGSFYETNFDTMPKSPSKPLLSEQAEKTLESVKQNMKPPPKQLADLLTAIASPDNHDDMDRGFMVRRKNACGALKVLTLNDRNRRTMCWTAGVLTALTSVLEDTGNEGLFDSFPDGPTRREYMEARTRAVTCILNLSTFKENRVPMFLSNGMMQAIIKVIFDDNADSRKGCCATIAYLAKQSENRLLMVQVPQLIDALCQVIKPANAPAEQPTKSKKKKNEKARKGRKRGTNHGDDDDGGNDDDSDVTEARTTSPRSAAQKASRRYDNDPNTCIHASRQSVFATLLHLIKEKDNAYCLARHMGLVEILVDISCLRNSPSHLYAVRLMANMTRHRENSKLIVSNIKIIVPALVNATSSPMADVRRFACYAIQNLAQEKSCRQEVASTKGLVLALCQRARQAPFEEEKLASISALKNLTDEPANLIPMTNTPECFATLMQIAHGNDANITDMMQYLACDALATLSHWLRKIATSGESADKKPVNKEKMFVPTLTPITFQQWS